MAEGTPTTSRQTRTPGFFRAFASPGYARLWVANGLLYTSRWMQITLLAWLILELTNSPWLVALVGFFSSAPMFVLGLVGGILADRGNRHRILVATQCVNGATSLLFTCLLSADIVEVWQAYATILITGACWALDTPSRRAVIYDLLGLDGVTNAVALDAVGMNVSRMCGPGLAGLLITVGGVTLGYMVITGFYAVALGLVWSVSVSQAPRPAGPRQRIRRNLLEGFHYVRSNRTIAATLYITVVMNVLLFPYVQMVPIIARDVLHVDAALMGAMQAAEGLGALVGAVLIAAAVNITYHGRLFLGGSLLGLTSLCLFSMSQWYILSLPALLLLGLGTAGFGAMQSTIIMLSAREEMRGRALGVLSLAIGTGPFGSLLMGAVANAIHPVFAIRMHALIGIVALACIAVLMPAFLDKTPVVRVTPRPRPARSS